MGRRWKLVDLLDIVLDNDFIIVSLDQLTSLDLVDLFDFVEIDLHVDSRGSSLEWIEGGRWRRNRSGMVGSSGARRRLL
jgi:hypothetical protein